MPDSGLHRAENRRATILFDVSSVPDKWFDDDWFFHSLGILIGERCGNAIPAVAGLPGTISVEQLRALGGAAATSGSVSMFHAIGITPEANDIESAFQGHTPEQVINVEAEDIEMTALNLSTPTREPVSAICVGAPHYSYAEFELLQRLINGRNISDGVRFVASTSAAVLGEIEREGMLDSLMSSGVEFVTGRCTYYRPVIAGLGTHVMTNSAKWAWYAPSDMNISVTFASLVECVNRAFSNE